VNGPLKQRRYDRRRAIALSVLIAASFGLTACSPNAGLKQLVHGGGTATKGKSVNGSAGNSTGGAAQPTTSNITLASANGNGPGTQGTSFAGVAMGGGSFDPAGLFNFYNDSIYVTEVGNTVYVSWESYVHGDEIYTSIAQGGQWVVLDKPVYSLAPYSNDGNWSRYLAGNELGVVDRFNSSAFMVRWNSAGQITTQQNLYKGWVGGDFPISVDGGWAVTLHLPYGAPAGGARYDLFLPSSSSNPQVMTTSISQFTGALYAYDTGLSRLYEIQTNKVGVHVLDVYQVGKVTSQTSTGANSVPVNTQLITDSSGKPIEHTLPALPQLLEVSPQGTVYTLTRDPKNPAVVSVTAYNKDLQQVAEWKQVKLANVYAQNVAMSVSSGTPHIFAVVDDNGQAGIQEITLK
jgi:hypothetical protein